MTNGYDRMHGGFGCGKETVERCQFWILWFHIILRIVNSHFKKEEDHLATFRSSITKIRIDYFLIRANNTMIYKDCKLIPGEYLGTQHRLLVMDVVIKRSKIKKRSVGKPRIKW